MIAARANELIRDGLGRGQPDPVHPRARGRRLLRLPRHLRRRPAERRRPRRDQGGRRPDRRRPARRGVGALLGRDRRPARPRPDRGEPAGRRDVAVHDARLGRQDPDGLLLALGDGLAWSRRRTGTTSPPATTRTPTGTASSRPDAGLMNPNHYLAVAIQYLFGAAACDRRLAGHRADRQDAGVELDDRPGRGAVWASRWSRCPVGFKWFVPGLLDGSFGFGGEESAGASFLRHGRPRVDDRQGRSDPLPARGRDHRARPAGRPASTTPTWSRSTATRRTPASTPRPTREQKAALAALSPDAVTATDAGRRADHREAHLGPGQRRRDRRAQGHHRVGLVRRPTVRHRGRLQDLRRVVPRRRAPGPGAGRGSRRGVGRAQEHVRSLSLPSTVSCWGPVGRPRLPR